MRNAGRGLEKVGGQCCGDILEGYGGSGGDDVGRGKLGTLEGPRFTHSWGRSGFFWGPLSCGCFSWR